MRWVLWCGLAMVACAPTEGTEGDPVDSDADTDGLAKDPVPEDTASSDTAVPLAVDPADFAQEVVSFTPGKGAGFGAEALPGVVLGRPLGGGEQGSLDVVSLGQGGQIVLGFGAEQLVDGPGVDLLVFENPFVGWPETGEVSVSEDGTTWHTWPCAAEDADGGYPGCAGVANVWAHPSNALDPTDPAVAGGEGYDLADLGLASARFVRITDSGHNSYAAPTGGFDLDAVAIVHRGGGE